MFEAFSYMGYYLPANKEYETAKAWYNRLLNLDPKNKEWQIKAFKFTCLDQLQGKELC